MQLIGMLDSPYVRRAAIGLRLLGLAFESRPVSVFSTYDQFQRINPVVKAPTLVLDDGTVLMDSTLILDHAEHLAGPARSLMPAAPAERLRALRLVGLALAASEKAVQIVYEQQRPAERRHAPWLARVREQLLAAWSALDDEMARQPPPLGAGGQAIGQAGLSIAVAWRFAQLMVPDDVPAARFPRQQAFSDAAEALPEFVAWPPV